MGKKGHLSDFECGMIVGARRAGPSISKTADLIIKIRSLKYKLNQCFRLTPSTIRIILHQHNTVFRSGTC